jgi:hypothetical protein
VIDGCRPERPVPASARRAMLDGSHDRGVRASPEPRLCTYREGLRYSTGEENPRTPTCPGR